MILTEKVEIKLNNFNLKRYEKLGYDVYDKDSIFIMIKDIGVNSTIRVESKCDVCGKIKSLQYKKYNKNISSGGYYACSNVCSKNKVEATNLNKYGSRYPLQSEEKINELKEYFLEKFGFDNPSKTKEVLLKREHTMLKKYGVKTNIILPETHKKAVEFSKLPESILKRKNTNIEKFGFDNPMKSKEIYNKFKETNIIKYGSEFPAQNVDIFNKTQISQFKMKTYNGIRYQGSYELDFLIFCDENGLLDRISKPMTIKYRFDDSDRVYYPDFFIEDINLIIEIKSNYYYNLHLEKNLIKEEYTKRIGYDFIFIIDKNYSDFMNKIKKSS